MLRKISFLSWDEERLKYSIIQTQDKTITIFIADEVIDLKIFEDTPANLLMSVYPLNHTEKSQTDPISRAWVGRILSLHIANVDFS